jgi:malonyl-CoA O-methyltransferase
MIQPRGGNRLDKKEIIRDYDATAEIYDSRYEEEQSIKISFIMRHAKAGSKDTVIDVGCGTGQLLKDIGETELAVGIDASLEMLKRAKKRCNSIQPILADVESLPLRDQCCDVVYSVSVLQLVEDPKKGIGEILRILKPGGMFAVSVLLKAGFARGMPKYFGEGVEFYESESMKDAFVFGQK